jgi:hypothetical protein
LSSCSDVYRFRENSQQTVSFKPFSFEYSLFFNPVKMPAYSPQLIFFTKNIWLHQLPLVGSFASVFRL